MRTAAALEPAPLSSNALLAEASLALGAAPRERARPPAAVDQPGPG